jgi:hypothetical protein
MAILDGTLIDTITYWTRSGLTNEGNPTYNTPVTTTGRWEQAQTLLRDSNGEDLTSDAYVYTNTSLNIGDWIFLGTSASASPPNTAFEIRYKIIRRDLSGSETITRYYL